MPEKMPSTNLKNHSKPNSFSMPTVESESSSFQSGSNPVMVILLVITIVAVAGFAWSFVNYRQAQKQIALLSTPEGQQTMAQNEVNRLVEKVGKLILLPLNEKPVVAEVKDAEKLAKTEPFYEQAHDGDRLLIYPNAKRAVLYSEKNNVVVNVGPIVLNETSNPAETPAVNSPAAKQIAPLSIEIRNGSTVVGAGSQVAEQLKTNQLFKITEVGNAANRDYKDVVLVVSETFKNSDAARQLAAAVKATSVVSVVPSGEAPSSADALVIIGNK